MLQNKKSKKSVNLHGQSLFSSQIYFQKIKASPSLNKELKKECEQLIENDSEGQNWSLKNYPFGYTSYGSNQSGYDRMHLVSSTFTDLRKRIDSHVKKYIKMLDYQIESKELQMTHCWVNIMGPNAHHNSHIHPLSVISGTYYVNTFKDSSCLRFEDPRSMFMMNTPLVTPDSALKNKRIVDLKPQNEHVVLFESWMKHEVVLSSSQKERISISFNYGWS